MKERIVIKDEFWVKHFQEREKDFYEEDLCSGGNPEEWWHYEKEKVPETFAELRELCQTLNTDRIRTTKQVIYIKPTSCWLGEIRVNCKGAIMNSDFQDIAYNRSMSQLWSFIKSLIGEEK